MKKELMVKFDSAKSFYKKAKIENIDGVITLYSYNTRVAELDGDNFKIINVQNVFSSTTLRHLKEFYRQNIENVELKKSDLEKYLMYN